MIFSTQLYPATRHRILCGGFSLVELSIVLVILGLLVGGVLSGQSLIHAAELRSILEERDKFIAATDSFKDKYFAIPGDMTNATKFWGTATSCASYGNATGTATCDGDGDGILATNSATSAESYRFWQQLADAGLIEGSYHDSSTIVPLPFLASDHINSPTSKYKNALWYVASWGDIGQQLGSASYFGGDYGNAFFIGSQNIYGQVYPLMVPADVWNIDTKADDGAPSTGNITVTASGAAYGNSSQCAGFGGMCSLTDCTTATDDTSVIKNYLLTVTAPNCAIAFRKAF